jgi:NAD(P)-dependent dehydrogenase (short-subunit alcohol dehydrogenase family)
MRTAIVTGASSGIGAATALALAEAGHYVIACGRDPERGAAATAPLRRTDGGGEFIALDLTAPDAPNALVDRAAQRTGRLDVVVNNAGEHLLATLEELGDADYDRLMDVNVRVPFRLTRAALPLLRDQDGGVVVNVASEAGLVAVPGQIAYNVSKAALVMFTKSLAADHARDKVRAVSICPGTTRTPLVERAIAAAPSPEDHERALASGRPAGRLGEPEEIAAAVVYAVGENAGFLTGSEIVIDGGYTSL